MDDHGAYGERLAETFHLSKAPVIVSRTFSKTEIAVTEIKCDIENNGLTSPIPPEDAFLITVQLRDCPKHELWLDDRPVKSGYLRAGATSIYDLRRNPIAHSVSPFHSLHFYVPHGAFNAIADLEGRPRVDEFDNNPGCGVDDRTLAGLGHSMLPAFLRQQEADKLFVDHVTVAVAAHALQAYGTRSGSQVSQCPQRALAPWQQRRAKELLCANLQGGLAVSDVAKECGLSVTEFCRAFRRSTGALPHHWLLRQRIETAVDLLRHSRLSVAEVAGASGFADERHLERVLLRAAGVRPGIWRNRN